MANNRKRETTVFGYWPRKVELHAGSAVIRPVDNYDDIVQATKQNDRVADGWLYPPLIEHEGRDGPSSPTLLYQRVFPGNSTHILSLPGTSDARVRGEFLIAVLGLLEGLRLVPEGWVHFYRAAIKRNSLSDVYCDRRDLELVLQIAEKFWATVEPKVRRLTFGAIHWRLFSESYDHEFERFSGQYTVLDTCWNIFTLMEPGWVPHYLSLSNLPKWAQSITNKKYAPHAVRPALLAKRYKMHLPSWARPRKGNACQLSKIRNGLVHEGRYGEEPIGFGYPKHIKGSIDFELAVFNTRLILAILGVSCGYIRSSSETHSCFALDIK